MCFGNSKPDLVAYYAEEDGTVHSEDVNEMFIPENIHEHVDSVFLNFDVNAEDGILALIYQAGNETFIVWTSDEAIELCYEPFSEISKCSEFELL